MGDIRGGTMIYSAVTIAEYVIDRCYRGLNHPINNMQLQKILYFIQGEYLAKFDIPLFYDDFKAWRNGASIPEVYYKYEFYISDPITEIYNVDLNVTSEEKVLIDDVIDRLAFVDTWDLVKMSLDKAWKDANGYEECSIITRGKIKECFKERMIVNE